MNSEKPKMPTDVPAEANPAKPNFSKRREFIRAAGIGAAALGGAAFAPLQTALGQVPGAAVSTGAQAKSPNIVFILTDNLGYGEVGCYGGGVTRGAATPRIDSLAKEGMKLLNANMETQCTPSRSSLMTVAGRFVPAPIPCRLAASPMA